MDSTPALKSSGSNMAIASGKRRGEGTRFFFVQTMSLVLRCRDTVRLVRHSFGGLGGFGVDIFTEIGLGLDRYWRGVICKV